MNRVRGLAESVLVLWVIASLSPLAAQESAKVLSRREAAQENAKTPGRRGTPASSPLSKGEVIRTYPLKHAVAAEVATVIGVVFQRQAEETGPSLRVAPDERTNSLVTIADAELTDSIEALISALDRGRSEASEPQLKIFPLVVVSAKETASAIMKLGYRAEVHADERTNTLVVRGTNEAFEQIRSVIQVLDRQPNRKPSPPDSSIRMVWLVESGGDRSAFPEDLKSIVDALRKKTGIGELSMAAQTIVRVGASEASQSVGEFTSSGQTKFGNYEFSGSLVHTGRHDDQLKLNFNARREGLMLPLCTLSTTCALKPGEPIVIGTTTLETRAAIIVIELDP